MYYVFYMTEITSNYLELRDFMLVLLFKIDRYRDRIEGERGIGSKERGIGSREREG